MRFSCNIVLILSLILPGCATYKRPTTYYLDHPPNHFELGGYQPEALQTPELYARRKAALNHWAYNIIPRHHTQIRFYSLGHWLTWALFGNEDDGIFGEEESADYNPDQPPSLWKAVKWTARNPLHNTTFYVVGRANSRPSQFTLISISDQGLKLFEYKKKGRVFAKSNGSCFFLGFHGGLPFVSLRLNHVRQTNLYLGWRERGNLGAKAQLAKELKSPPPAPPLVSPALTDMETESYPNYEEPSCS